MIEQLKKQYNVLEVIDLDAWHDKSAIERNIWLTKILESVHRPCYESNDRLVFNLMRGDIYDNNDSETGVFIKEFQQILNHVDISNFFVILITSDPGLEQTYNARYRDFSFDSVPISIMIDTSIPYQKQIKQSKKRSYNYLDKNPTKIDIQQLDQRKRELLTDSGTFCIYPWNHIHVYPNGQAYPCCHAEMKHSLGTAKNNTLEEIWNHEPMRQLRRNMLENKQSEACSKCYEQEESGFVSGRISANKHHGHLIHKIDHTDSNGYLSQFQLTYWDVRFSNLCNLRCRSCGHIFSSQWYQDQAKLAGPDWKTHNSVLNYAGRTETDMWSQLEPHLDYVEQIYFAGGEPLLMEEHYNILEELVRRGRFDVRLIYNTNFTHTDLKGRSVFEYWQQFKSVSVGASLDGMAHPAEYIRKGTVWYDVVKNRHDMIRLCPQVDFYISPTLSILNAWHLPDFHREWCAAGLIQPQDLNVNILQDPAHYRIDIAPAKYKQQLEDKYLKHLDWMSDRDPLGRATQGFKSAITFMNATDNSFLVPKFWEKTQQLDAIRNENVLDVLPELQALK